MGGAHCLAGAGDLEGAPGVPSMNLGAGGFAQAAGSPYSVAIPRSVAIGDFDGDGDSRRI